MNKYALAAIVCAALSLHALAAAPADQRCPGAASWCDDFGSGASHWRGLGSAAVTLRQQANSANHLLQAAGGDPLLIADDIALLTNTEFFLEARVRAATPAASGRVILLAHYTDARNWIGASAAYTAGSKRLAIELLRMRGGELERLKQVGRDTGSAGEFKTLRLELGGDTMAVYLDGERLTTAPVAFLPGGRVGVMVEGGEADIDDVRIGPAGRHPARVALARMDSRIGLQAGEPPRRFAVSALDGDGVTPLPFAAISSNPAIASVAVDGDALVVTAHRPGAATITLASTADRNAAAALALTVDPAFAPSTQSYALKGRIAPAPRASGVPPDTLLRINFDGAPTLGGTGSVRIYRASDGALADVIRLADETDTIGYAGQEYKRVVRYTPVRIEGAQAIIRPHNARLDYDTEYEVAIDDGVFNAASIAGQPFTGLGRQAGWRFRTRAAPPTGSTLTVDDDGPADFRTVQGALNHAMRAFSRAWPVTIAISNGRYEELLYLRGKDRVTLRGASRDRVVIHAANNERANPGSGVAQPANSPSVSGGRSLWMIEDADLLTVDTLTFVNTTTRATSAGGPQAETLYFNSENGRLTVTNASFFSEQDTLQLKGYAWFYRSLVAGNVDFIWGYNRAALFEQSEIRSLGDSANAGSGGYLVQARTVAAGDPGFVFLDSRLTHGPGPAGNDVPAGATYLARSPGTASTWDKVTFISCRIDRHVAAIGWAGAGVQGQPAPNPALSGPGSGWTEYGSMDANGQPLDMARRVGGAVLPAPPFTSRAAVFQGFNGGRGWHPLPSP